MDLDGDGKISIYEFAHAISAGMVFDDTEHEYYRRQKRQLRSVAELRAAAPAFHGLSASPAAVAPRPCPRGLSTSPP